MVAAPPRRRRGLAQKTELPATPRVVYFLPRGKQAIHPARAVPTSAERRGRGRRRHFGVRHGDWQADELTRGYAAARRLCYPAMAHGAAHGARRWPLSTYRLSRGKARAEVSWHTVVCDCRVNAGAAGRTRLGLGWAWGGWGVGT
eukprot:scaffold49516_cov56-Phaeocystis_antarctica.AAC.3